MYLSPVNYQSNVMHNKVNQKTNIKNADTVAFKGINFKPKTTNISPNIITAGLTGIATLITAVKIYCSCDKEFNQAWKKRLNAMAECDSYGEVPERTARYNKRVLQNLYIKNPELTKQLMVSTIEDGLNPWVEYSAEAIDLIVENNKEHPEKTELLKKCLSRSYEHNKNIYSAAKIVNTHSEKMIQEALIKAGYQENKVWHFPQNFYSPDLFTIAAKNLSEEQAIGSKIENES